MIERIKEWMNDRGIIVLVQRVPRLVRWRAFAYMVDVLFLTFHIASTLCMQ
jgi:hypothetical protein